MGTSLTEQLQDKLTDGLESAFDVVRDARREQYEKNPPSAPHAPTSPSSSVTA